MNFGQILITTFLIVTLIGAIIMFRKGEGLACFVLGCFATAATPAACGIFGYYILLIYILPIGIIIYRIYKDYMIFKFRARIVIGTLKEFKYPIIFCAICFIFQHIIHYLKDELFINFDEIIPWWIIFIPFIYIWIYETIKEYKKRNK